MDTMQIITLALVQGLTEFLPISSSAHLILVPVITGWEDQGLAFDVAVHVGTLTAVVCYFRHEVATMTTAWFASWQRREISPDGRLAWTVLVGTIPVGVAGLLFADPIAHYLRSPLVIAVTTVGFGLLLGWADRYGVQRCNEYNLSWRAVIVIGCAQALALIPGTSRSGITMTAGLVLGLTRQASARFSFLLSIPVICLAGALETVDLLGQSQGVNWQVLLWGTLLSAISAYVCIHFFLQLLERIGMMPFVIYRLILGSILLLLFL